MAPRKSTRKNSGRKSTARTRTAGSTSTAVAKRDPAVHGVPGVDYTENTPVTHVNIGDGSDENPHNIVPRHDWQTRA